MVLTENNITLMGGAAIGLIFVGTVIYYFRDTILNPLRNLHVLNLFHVLSTTDDGPLMWSNDISNPDIALAGAAEIEGHFYSMVATKGGRAILQVGLHKRTTIHLFALGSKSGWQRGFKRIKLGRVLSKIELEGDFPNYFAMYCTEDKKVDLLHIFDPADMAYFVDFCQAYDFEICNNTLYIAQAAGARDKNDNTTMVDDARIFLQRNAELLTRL